MRKVSIIEYDDEINNKTSPSSSLYTLNSINSFESYVINNIRKGHHSDYCYAWLETGLCATSLLNIKCCYNHDYPSNWSKNKIIRHLRLLKFIQWLFNNKNDDDSITCIDINNNNNNESTDNYDEEYVCKEECSHVIEYE